MRSGYRTTLTARCLFIGHLLMLVVVLLGRLCCRFLDLRPFSLLRRGTGTAAAAAGAAAATAAAAAAAAAAGGLCWARAGCGVTGDCLWIFNLVCLSVLNLFVSVLVK